MGGGTAKQCVEPERRAALAPTPAGYQRREPEKTLLYQVVNAELGTFLETMNELGQGKGLPGFVIAEFERYLKCGIAAHGFVRVYCPVCQDDLIVAFSCKNRGVCPSCGSRRMHDVALHLVDRVLPHVPFRQWVLSYPKRIRPLLARDAELACRAQTIFLNAVFGWQRRQARQMGLHGVGAGAVAFSQRFGDSLNLNVHTHALVPDGLFTKTEAGGPGALFHRLEKPKDEDVEEIAKQVVVRTHRLLQRRGLLERDEDPDVMDSLAAAAQRPLLRLFEEEPRRRARLSAFVEGFSLQAGTHVHENDRAGLERLCRYGARPPIALHRLQQIEDGRLRYSLKYPLPNGSYALELTPQEMMKRLALLVPRPRIHLVRYKGVFASSSSWRQRIVPAEPDIPLAQECNHEHQVAETSRPASSTTGAALVDRPLALPQTPTASKMPQVAFDASTTESFEPVPAPNPRERYLDWASLLRRTFGADLLICATCGGSRRIIAFIEDGEVAETILDHLGLPSTPPPRAAAQSPPQLELFDPGPAADAYLDSSVPDEPVHQP